MSWFSKLFSQKKPTELSSNSLDFNRALDAYEEGFKLYRANKFSEALKYFNIAIESGLNTSGIIELRAGCYQGLEEHSNAIIDFNMAISLSPHNCNIYFMRSNSKKAIKDFDGAILDLKKAIDLSTVNNSMNYGYVLPPF